MSLSSLEQAIPAGDRLLLDSSCLIAYLNGGEATTPVAVAVIDYFVKSGRNTAIISMVTVMEVLVLPLKKGAGPFGHALSFLTTFPNFELISIDLPVAHQAASLRALMGFKPPDALVVGTGFVAQVGHLVTNDGKWLRLNTFPDQHIQVCYLEKHLPFP